MDVDESSWQPFKRSRFGEPLKYLPVLFVWLNIGSIYTIYMVYHLLPRLANSPARGRSIAEVAIFNTIIALIVTSYWRCFATEPGRVPDSEADPTWTVTALYGARPADAVVSLQETKRSGDRRKCKWCGVFKPDRCHHCRICRTCVLKMDHHCPWVYNCIGLRNHKFFFLFLFYCVLGCHLVVWTMLGTTGQYLNNERRFIEMFLVLFGETLTGVIALVITPFYLFHVWLMVKAMTTIEFCEKSMRSAGYDSSAYRRGLLGNIRAVLGDRPLLWFVPCSPPTGTGLSFTSEETPFARDVEVGRSIRRRLHQKSGKERSARRGVDMQGSGQSGEESISDSGIDDVSVGRAVNSAGEGGASSEDFASKKALRLV